MSSTLINILIGVGLIACVILIVVISRQLKAQRERREQIAANEQKQAERAREHRQYLIDSVRLISSAVLHDEKMTMTEGCIRLKILLDNLAPQLLLQPKLVVIQEVYAQTEHIPFLDQWKALKPVAKRKFEKEMAEIESRHEQDIRAAMHELQQYPLDKTAV